MMTNVKKVGRPKLPEEKRQKYGRIAVYPKTHNRIKQLSKKVGLDMVEYLEQIIPRK